VIETQFKVHQDFRSNTDFISIFIPLTQNFLIDSQIFGLIKYLRDQIPTHRDELRHTVIMGMRGRGMPYNDSKDMKFSGRVFIYTAHPYTVIQLGELMQWYQEAGMALEIRGLDYWDANKDR